MILLDTNVISEPWRPAPDPVAIAWLDAQVVETLFLSAVTVGELRYGVAILPAGRRRDRLADRFEQDVLPLFTGRILPFDVGAARAFGDLMAQARASGHPMSFADGAIAAIAASRALTVASRDVHPFRAAGVAVLDPWAGPGA
jgi:hypothetical protein